MSFEVNKPRQPKRNIQVENNNYLIESWINGNRSYVRGKFKKMRFENKGVFLQQAKETMTAEDYDDLNKGLYQ